MGLNGGGASAERIRVLPDAFDLEEKMLERAKSLINDALSLGCIAALQKHDHNVKCLTDPIREKYIDLIDLQPSDDVLEIGSSMGQHTRRIAAKCRSVNALEVIKFQAEFSKIWCGQEGLQNVHFTAGGASGHLPYENSSFDVVISNYVLEWCAGRAAGDPNEFHKEVLSEIWRVLKPGGRLFLSTKNRFAFKYLTGVEDEHLGIRFGSALPRWIQKRAAATARLGHPTGYLHSWAGLRADLIAAGFKNLVPLFAFPDARWPVFLGRAQDFSRSNITSPEGINFGKRDRALAVLPSQTRLALSNSIIYLADR